jgi:superfamily II DNA/RNA helicase
MKAEDYVHRIGRTGRAGRSGLAVTLAERRDAGMIQRIQRFTTQRIPSATIVGLEPKRAEPRPEARPGGFAGRPARPGAGHRPFKPHGRPAGEAGAERRAADGPRHGPHAGPQAGARPPRPFGDGPKARAGKPPMRPRAR